MEEERERGIGRDDGMTEMTDIPRKPLKRAEGSRPHPSIGKQKKTRYRPV